MHLKLFSHNDGDFSESPARDPIKFSGPVRRFHGLDVVVANLDPTLMCESKPRHTSIKNFAPPPALVSASELRDKQVGE